MMHLLLQAYSQDNQLAVSAYPQLLVNSHSDLYIHNYYDYEGKMQFIISTYL